MPEYHLGRGTVGRLQTVSDVESVELTTTVENHDGICLSHIEQPALSVPGSDADSRDLVAFLQESVMLPPHWLDAAISSKLDTGDAKRIAEAVAQSPEFLAAIKAGLDERPPRGVVGPSHAQIIRRGIQEAIE